MVRGPQLGINMLPGPTHLVRARIWVLMVRWLILAVFKSGDVTRGDMRALLAGYINLQYGKTNLQISFLTSIVAKSRKYKTSVELRCPRPYVFVSSDPESPSGIVDSD